MTYGNQATKYTGGEKRALRSTMRTAVFSRKLQDEIDDIFFMDFVKKKDQRSEASSREGDRVNTIHGKEPSEDET
jgi:hypothetical protein